MEILLKSVPHPFTIIPIESDMEGKSNNAGPRIFYKIFL